MKIHDKPNCRYNLLTVFRYGRLRGLCRAETTQDESELVVIRRILQLLTQPFINIALRPNALLRQFEAQRELLELQFFERASSTGLPRGLRWLNCDWLSVKILLRDRTTNQPNLLVSINLRFAAIAGSDMDDVAAVSNIRDACAVFQWQGNTWTTSGRTLFNMNPEEARERLAASYEPM